MSALTSYLEAARGKPWAWRVHDCCAFAAGWAGIELPEYDGEAEAAGMIAGAGGMARLWERIAGKRLRLVTRPEAGDVGIIRLIDQTEFTDLGAIYSGRRWMFVPFSGGLAGVTSPIAVWAYDCGRRGDAL